MKYLITILIGLGLVSLEAVVVKYLGFSITRIDVCVSLIAFLALRAGTLEGAFSSFAIGYVLDVMSGHPTGLYMFLGVFLFLMGRLAASLVDVRSGFGFALYAMAGDAAFVLLQTFFTWLVAAKGGGGAFALLPTLPVQVALTGAAAALLYPLLRRIDPGNERPEAGALL